MWNLIDLANKHQVNILQPGQGRWALLLRPLVHCKCVARKSNKKLARTVNNDKPEWVIEKVISKINTLSADRAHPDNEKIKIVCFGLAFKANIDDFRESPALYIVRKLAEKYVGQVYVVEPNIATSPSKDQELFTYISYEEGID